MRIFVFIFLVVLFSCKEKKGPVKVTVKHTKETLEQVNRLLVNKDAERIKSYVERRGWNMLQSETGLWYMLYQEGQGELIERGDRVTLNFKLWLIDGTLCYSSDSMGKKQFKVGQGGVEAGLEEGLLLMKKQGKARLILPPYLAHGLIGDENRIPGRAIVIYDIEVVDVTN